MFELKRTDARDADFQRLAAQLDLELIERDGEDTTLHDDQTEGLIGVVLAFDSSVAVACGAFREYDGATEIERMYVSSSSRGRGIARAILTELESLAASLGYKSCVLGTGVNQPEAISLYTSQGYVEIASFGQYATIRGSVCFARELSSDT